MLRSYDCKIVLSDGSEYPGCRFGARTDRVCEIVFNTSMVGYQEIVSDPSYTGQLVVMTYPIIGNYGVTDEDFETKIPTIGGLVVREYNDIPSNFRYTKTLSEILEDYGIPAIEGVDTRKLTRSIRDHGSRKALLTDIGVPTAQAVARLNAEELRRDQVAQVSCKKRWYARTSNHRCNVVAVDCGIKLNIVRSLNGRGCNVTVVPYDTAAADILRMEPDGVFLSNGPGDPEDVTPVIELVRQLRGKFPYRYSDAACLATANPKEQKLTGLVAVVSAGTSDLAVCEEAALTAEALGSRVERVYDAGVAGLHRLLAELDTLTRARCIVAVAGMEGALPSVVGGLVSCPVIAVPTSVGYGANLGGVAALLAMLNSCASGISVVNIDNGFGAGFLASRINQMKGVEET